MPYLQLVTNIPQSKIPIDFTVHVTNLLSEILQKPREYCCIQILAEQIMAFGGSHEPCAHVIVKCIGRLGPNENKSHSQRIMNDLYEYLGILPHLTYVHFIDCKPSDVNKDLYLLKPDYC